MTDLASGVLQDSGLKLMDAREELAYELRAQDGSIWTGGRILIGIVSFAFAALGFAYFYLRTSNTQDLWRPNDITAPTAIGAGIFALSVAAALLSIYGATRLRTGATADWAVSNWTALLGLLIAAGLQVWEFTQLPFFPGSSGYSSCFVGWAVMNTGFLLGCAYWIETLLARSMRLQRASEEDGGPARSALPGARLFRTNVEACTAFLVFAIVVEVLFWVLIYEI